MTALRKQSNSSFVIYGMGLHVRWMAREEGISQCTGVYWHFGHFSHSIDGKLSWLSWCDFCLFLYYYFNIIISEYYPCLFIVLSLLNCFLISREPACLVNHVIFAYLFCHQHVFYALLFGTPCLIPQYREKRFAPLPDFPYCIFVTLNGVLTCLKTYQSELIWIVFIKAFLQRELG